MSLNVSVVAFFRMTITGMNTTTKKEIQLKGGDIVEKVINLNKLCKACKNACKQNASVKIYNCDYIRELLPRKTVIVKVKER